MDGKYMQTDDGTVIKLALKTEADHVNVVMITEETTGKPSPKRYFLSARSAKVLGQGLLDVAHDAASAQEQLDNDG